MMNYSFSSTLPIVVYTRPMTAELDWQEFDRGPGIFQISEDRVVSIRARGFTDAMLQTLVEEIRACLQVISLNLAENRNITDDGIAYLKEMRQLIDLNVSSCGLSNRGIDGISALPNLARLNLSYCNRISDLGLRKLKNLTNLQYLDLQGCIKITHSGLTKLNRRGLTIHK